MDSRSLLPRRFSEGMESAPSTHRRVGDFSEGLASSSRPRRIGRFSEGMELILGGAEQSRTVGRFSVGMEQSPAVVRAQRRGVEVVETTAARKQAA
jgi:hypothetical protein